MGRILQTDKRYKMLSKMPRVQDGRVVFRKKPGKAKYIIAIMEADDHIHSVLYRMTVVVNDGIPVTIMSFWDYQRA